LRRARPSRKLIKHPKERRPSSAELNAGHLRASVSEHKLLQEPVIEDVQEAAEPITRLFIQP
jgi:hypothetical protein